MRRNLFTSRKLLGVAAVSAAALAALLAIACNGASSPSTVEGGPIRVVGTLTAEGVECPAMRGDDGKLYTMGRDAVRGLEVGDRVRVTGRVAGASFCMQGVTILVDSIEKI